MNIFTPNTSLFNSRRPSGIQATSTVETVQRPGLPPPTDLNAFLINAGAVGMNENGQPIGSTGGLVPLQGGQRQQLAAFTNPSPMQYNGNVNNLGRLEQILGVQNPQQGVRVPQSGGAMRVPQSQFAVAQDALMGVPSGPAPFQTNTPTFGMVQPPAPTKPTQVSAFGEQVRQAGSPVSRNGAMFEATDTGFSITQDPATVPQPGQGQTGLPAFLQGVNPQTIAPVVNAMRQSGDPEQIRNALLAGTPPPEGISQEEAAAWTLQQAALGQQSAALYDQIRRSGMPVGSYGTGLLTNAMNRSLSGGQGGMGITPVEQMAQNTAANINRKPIQTIEITEGDEIVTRDANTGQELGRAPRTALPAGMERAPDGSLRPIPGSEQAKKEQAASEKREIAKREKLVQAETVLSGLEEVLPRINWNTAGLAGTLQSLIPGTEARDVKGLIDTIKARVGFDELQAMRQSSPTGGALGQVAVQELVFLQASLRDLDQSQSPAQLRKNLGRIQDHYTRWKMTTQGINPNEVEKPAEKTTASVTGNAARQIGRFVVEIAGESK